MTIVAKNEGFFCRSERTFVFIDGPNTYATAKALNIDIDYKKVLVDLRNRSHLVRAYYYTTVVTEEGHSTLRPLLDWLDYNGFSVVTKPLKEGVAGDRLRSSMEVELTIDAMRLAMNQSMDHMVLFSGNGNYHALITYAKSEGVRTTVVSSLKSRPPAVADELRRAADHFIDIDDLGVAIVRGSTTGLPDRV